MNTTAAEVLLSVDLDEHSSLGVCWLFPFDNRLGKGLADSAVAGFVWFQGFNDMFAGDFYRVMPKANSVPTVVSPKPPP